MTSRWVSAGPWRRGWVLALALWMLATAPALAAAPGKPPHYRVVAYDTAAPDAPSFDVDKVDVLIFAFAKVHDGDVVLAPEAAARLKRLVALKKAHPRLRVTISVGGWGAGGFSEAAATAAGRQRFARTAAAMVAANHADGLDVDWEYPGNDQSGIKASPDDRAHFTALLHDLRTELDRVAAAHGRSVADAYLLTIASADGRFVEGIDLKAVAPYLDWFNLMTYDFNNSLTPTTGHHTGLYAAESAPPDARTTRRAVRQYLAAGVPADKIVIGVAFYGIEFDGVRARDLGRYQPYTGKVGAHPWPELLDHYIGHGGYERHWDEAARAPYLWNPATHSFVSYDDPRSIAAKAAFVKAHHLGGIMYWEQSQDRDDRLLDAVWRGLH